MKPVLMCGGIKNDGPAWYRVEQPARWLRAHGVDVRVAYDTVTEEDVKGGLSTFSTQRGWDGSLLLGLGALKRAGIRTMYEIDDDIWSVPGWSNAKPWFTDENIRRMEAVMRACDFSTVSTERLAGLVVRQTQKRVYIVPNAIPLDLVPELGPRTKPGVRVGWWGSDTHAKDLTHALPAMKRLLRERPEVVLVFMGAPLPDGLAAGQRVEYHGWLSTAEFYAKLRELELDVVVAPLEDHRFNYAKSNIKVLEAAALGVPVVASDVGPYQCIKNGETGFKVKFNRPDLWGSLLMDLVRDETLRARVGAGARAWVEKEHNMDCTGPLWAEALGVTL